MEVCYLLQDWLDQVSREPVSVGEIYELALHDWGVTPEYINRRWTEEQLTPPTYRSITKLVNSQSEGWCYPSSRREPSAQTRRKNNLRLTGDSGRERLGHLILISTGVRYGAQQNAYRNSSKQW